MKIIGIKPPVDWEQEKGVKESEQYRDTLMTEEIKERMSKKYTTWWENEGRHMSPNQLLYLAHFTGRDIVGKTILDLGCGARTDGEFERYGKEYEERGEFHPWLCRTLHEIGITCIGIDIGNNKGETFEVYRINLLKENALSFLTDHSVDIAHARLVFSSERIGRRAGEYMKNLLIPQLERIVKSEGCFAYY